MTLVPHELIKYVVLTKFIKIFSFCEQILKIGSNDASGEMLQAFEVRYMSFFSENNNVVLGDFN